MEINVVCGVGTGKTILSAFDSALKDAGVYNYNLITLSSIIPPGSKVIKAKRYESPPQEYGHKLYVVKAEYRSEEVGKYIAAGVLVRIFTSLFKSTTKSCNICSNYLIFLTL